MAKRRRQLYSKRSSAIAGGILLGLGCLWLGWLLLGQHNGSSSGSFIWPIPGINATPTAAPIPQLSAAGINISSASTSSSLNEQQARTIANGLEPDAATHAKSTNARYVLLNYAPTANSTHATVTNTPVWMVVYQHIPIAPNDASVDPVPSTRTYHDLYVFVDANSGKEILSVWL